MRRAQVVTADLFPEGGDISVVRPSGLWWRRRAVGDTRKANYYLMRGELAMGYVVRWCGHPTALRPYYLTTPAGIIPGAWRSSIAARNELLRLYLVERPI